MEGARLNRLRPGSSTQQEFHEAQGSGTSSLDPEVWSRLPYECLCCILERVPVDSLMRWRQVSKTWIQSFLDRAMHGRTTLMPPVGESVPLFHAHLGTLALTGTLGYLVSKHFYERIPFTMKTFNRSGNVWEPLQLNLDEAQSKNSKYYEFYTSGGIILLNLWFRNVETVGETSSMIVFNPTTARRRQLPPSLDALDRPIGVLSSSNGRSYAVVATRWVPEVVGSQLLVYKSESGSWHDCGVIPGEMRATPFDSTASVRNVFYFMAKNRTNFEFLQNLSLCGFDLASGTCQELGELPRHYGMGRPSLIANGDHLLYVALSVRALIRTWTIYKFDTASQSWNDSTTMPEQVYQDLNEMIDGSNLNISGAGNYIYFYGAPVSHNFELYRVLSHNTSNDTWVWLPDLVTPSRDTPIFQGVPLEEMPIFKGYPVVYPLEPSFMLV